MVRSWTFRFLQILILGWLLCTPAIAKDDPVIQFIENKNQWRAPVLFRASSPVSDIYLLADRIQYLIFRQSDSQHGHLKNGVKIAEGGPHQNMPQWVTSQLFEVAFVNGNKKPVIEPEDPAVTSYNYFIGNDSSRWGSKARGFGTVWYRQVYPGIDLKIYSDKGHVKQDWVVSPQHDPRTIQLAYDGAESVYLKDGNLMISTRAGEISELQPFAYQVIAGVKVAILCSYKLKRNIVTFSLPHGYDPACQLVIDPILVFSGYSGSTYDNWGNTATFGERGTLYSGGMISDTYGGKDFPATPGAYRTSYIGGEWDIGILKYDSSGGSLLYATYVGGNGSESPHSLVINQAGELLILGATSSTDFPVTNGTKFQGGTKAQPILGTHYDAGSDIYIAKLSQDGSKLVSATYLGGTANDGLNYLYALSDSVYDVPGALVKNYGDETRGDIITDAANNVYFVSNSRSADLPVINSDPNARFHGGSHDAIVMKLTPDLSSVIWNRFLGGSDIDVGYSIKLGPANDVYVAGGTASNDFSGMNGLHSTAPGNIDGWVAHLSAGGDQILNATYLGTSAYDQAYFLDLDTDFNVYVYGQTQGPYPVQGTVYSNPNSGQFIHKLSNDLTTSLLSTVVGTGSNSPDISPTAFLVSECGHIYISGWGGILNGPFYEHPYYIGGSTYNLPVTANAYQTTTSGNDFYFMVLSEDAGKFLYGTFLGGKESLTHVDGGTSRFNKNGVVFHSVCANCGYKNFGFPDNDFPAVNVPPARQHDRSDNCNNAAFKFDLSLLFARLQTNSVKLDHPGLINVCLNDTIVFQNKSLGGVNYRWNLGDGTSLIKTDTSRILHVYKKVGSYSVTLYVFNETTCRSSDSAIVRVHVVRKTGSAEKSQTICGGTSVSLHASGGAAYLWTSSDGKYASASPDITVTPADSTSYFIKILDPNACVVRDTIRIGVIPEIPLDLSVRRTADCAGRPSVDVSNLSGADDPSILLDFGDGTTTTNKQEAHNYSKDGTYIVRLTAKRAGCTFEKDMTERIYTLDVPNVITPEPRDGLNDAFRIYVADPKDKITTADTGLKVSLLVYNRWGKTVYKNDDYTDQFTGDGLSTGTYYFETIIDNERSCKGWLQILK